MRDRLLLSSILVVVFAYGSYMAAMSIWNQPGPYLFGGLSGLLLGLAFY